MELKYGFISADDHVQEHPAGLDSSACRKPKWGDRIPHVSAHADGSERWVVDGQPIALPGVALAGCGDGGPRRRNRNAGRMCRRWFLARRNVEGDGCRRRRLLRALSERQRRGRRSLWQARRCGFGARLRAGLQRLADRGMGQRQPALCAAVYRADLADGANRRGNSSAPWPRATRA